MQFTGKVTHRERLLNQFQKQHLQINHAIKQLLHGYLGFIRIIRLVPDFRNESQLFPYFVAIITREKCMKTRMSRALLQPEWQGHSKIGGAKTSPLAGLERGLSPIADRGIAHKAKLFPQSQEAASMGAKAFTRGNEVHFAPGAYQPETAAGREIIAHEAVHVEQQALGKAQGGGNASSSQLEREAQMGSSVLSAAPYGLMQKFSRGAGSGGGGGKDYVKYEFKSKHFVLQTDPVEDTLRSWYFGGHAQGFEIPYEDKTQVEAKKSLQMALNLINKDPNHRSSELYLDPDGQFGSNTQRVIIAFQKKHGLDPDGVIGESTAKLMDEILAQIEEKKTFNILSKTRASNKAKYQLFSPKDQWERGNMFYFQITPLLDKDKPKESVGWNGVNEFHQTRNVIEYLKAMGLMDKKSEEDERSRLIHYNFEGWDDQEHVQQWVGETPAMEYNPDNPYDNHQLHVTDRFDENKLSETIKAIQKVQKKYGFPQTGRLVKGTKEYELFEKIGLDAWCREWKLGEYSEIGDVKSQGNLGGYGSGRVSRMMDDF